MIPEGLRALFARLDAAGIRYVVLRGYIPLGELAESADIDVYIAAGERRRAETVFAQAGWLERRTQNGRYPHRFYDSFEVPGRVCTMLDVVYGLYYGDRLYALAHAGCVLASSEPLEGIRVPHPWVALFTFALHVTLDKEALSDHNARRGRALWEQCRARADGPALLERDFGAEARRFAEAFGQAVAAGASDIAALQRQALGLPCLSPRPVFARLDDLRGRILGRLRRPLRVAVLGMDGSGKSTLIERTRALPSPLPIGSGYLGYNQFATALFRYLERRVGELQALGRGEGWRVKLLDKARALWWPFELYARMRRAERGRAIVLYDRYPFPAYERDDRPTTIPGHVMVAYERLWTALLPGPQILLLLDGKPETIWSRKQEYPFEEFLHARERLLRLADEFPGERHRVATDGPVETSLSGVTDALRSSRALRRRLYHDAP